MPTTTKTTTRKPAAKKGRRKSNPDDVYQRVTDRIVEQLEAGVVPWRPMWTRVDPNPRNLSTGGYYKGCNWMLMLMMGYASPYWITMRQANELGGKVRKGERSLPCVRWVDYERKLTPAQAQEARGKGEKVTTNEDGVSVLRLIVPKTFLVFNSEQCEGLEIPEEPEAVAHEWDPIEQAEGVWTGYMHSEGAPSFTEGGSTASYMPGLDRLTMPLRSQFPQANDYYHVAFHEAIHSTGHPSRLDRPQEMATVPYSKEELIAEVGAAMLCARAGLPIPAEQSAAYLDGYIKTLKGDSRLVVTAGAAAQRAADLILAAGNPAAGN